MEKKTSSLDKYNEIRDFNSSPEPAGTLRYSGREPVFVVQEHDASHLHFDFRLEADGVLKSWAVPKGPSLNPQEKRLAVQVEDHPLDYGGFEGIIPEGQYGAGTVEIWDSGTYTPLEKHRDVGRAIEEGLLEFSLHGRKLKGRFTLVRTRMSGNDKNWLLLKNEDPYAVHREWNAVDFSST